MSVRRRLFILLFLCLAVAGQKCYSQIDSTYIGFFSHELSIRPYFSDSFTALSCQFGDDDEITYRPNAPFGLGIGITYKGYSISGSYGFGFMRDKKKGNTKATDFQYHHYGRKFVMDLFFQRYKRFYIEREREVYDLFSDIKLTQYGGFAQYVFNGNRFSYQAAFDQNQRQLKSTGSFLLGGGVYYNKVESDSTLAFNNGAKMMENVQIGVSLGYAYTWVINKRVYISGSIAVGANLGAEGFDKLGKKEEWKIYPTVFPRFSAGYNHDNWSLGLSVVNNRVYILFSDEAKMAFDTGAIQFRFIKRFDSLESLLTPVFLNKKGQKK